MFPPNDPFDPLAAGAALGAGPVVLAVSGGADSMAMMHLAAGVADPSRVVVATFNHGTGDFANQAERLVHRQARALGLAVVSQRAAVPGTSEAEWREQRWDFLRSVAAPRGARVATAHTLDDHLETLVFRVLRDSGARGLAGLLAPSATLVRPMVRYRREQVRNWARSAGVEWVEDPSNCSPRHARNRIRHEILPALVAVRPGFDAELLQLSFRAVRVREGLDRLARTLIVEAGGRRRIPREHLDVLPPAERAALWPALLAQFGVTMDWRGIERLASLDAKASGWHPLAGGWSVVFEPGFISVARRGDPRGAPVRLPQLGEVSFGGWRFRAELASRIEDGSTWSAVLPVEGEVEVRGWEPGDRVVTGQGRRRVKRYLTEAGIRDPERRGWPVVVTGGEIVWVPGASRVAAAPERSGRPYRLVTCERILR